MRNVVLQNQPYCKISFAWVKSFWLSRIFFHLFSLFRTQRPVYASVFPSSHQLPAYNSNFFFFLKTIPQIAISSQRRSREKLSGISEAGLSGNLSARRWLSKILRSVQRSLRAPRLHQNARSEPFRSSSQTKSTVEVVVVDQGEPKIAEFVQKTGTVGRFRRPTSRKFRGDLWFRLRMYCRRFLNAFILYFYQKLFVFWAPSAQKSDMYHHFLGRIFNKRCPKNGGEIDEPSRNYPVISRGRSILNRATIRET